MKLLSFVFLLGISAAPVFSPTCAFADDEPASAAPKPATHFVSVFDLATQYPGVSTVFQFHNVGIRKIKHSNDKSKILDFSAFFPEEKRLDGVALLNGIKSQIERKVGRPAVSHWERVEKNNLTDSMWERDYWNTLIKDSWEKICKKNRGGTSPITEIHIKQRVAPSAQDEVVMLNYGGIATVELDLGTSLKVIPRATHWRNSETLRVLRENEWDNTVEQNNFYGFREVIRGLPIPGIGDDCRAALYGNNGTPFQQQSRAFLYTIFSGLPGEYLLRKYGHGDGVKIIVDPVEEGDEEFVMVYRSAPPQREPENS